MKKYKVLLHGKNFSFDNEGKLVKGGFLTTRFIEANTLEEAKKNVVKIVWQELGTSPEGADDPVTIEIEEIQEIKSFGNNPVPGEGFTFYVAEDEAQSKNEKEEK